MNCTNLKIFLEKAVSFLLTVKYKIWISVFFKFPVSTDFSWDSNQKNEVKRKKIYSEYETIIEWSKSTKKINLKALFTTDIINI